MQVLQSTVYLRLPNGLVCVTKIYCDVNSDVLCRYPFDVQKCKMDLSIKKGFAPFTKLLADQLRYVIKWLEKVKHEQNCLPRYDGPPALTKYDIQETKIEVV